MSVQPPDQTGIKPYDRTLEQNNAWEVCPFCHGSGQDYRSIDLNHPTPSPAVCPVCQGVKQLSPLLQQPAFLKIQAAIEGG